MISGIEFSKICDWNLCDRYPIKFDLMSVKDNDYVFINLENIDNFINYLNHFNFNLKINMVLHNSDLSFSINHLNKIKKFIYKIYSINCIVNDDMVKKIPLGFSDRLLPIILSVDKECDKQNLLYMNFNIHSGRIPERVECYNYFKDFDWVLYENLISDIDYYNSLKNCKYSVCPVGAGIDTHRFYESIYFETIPIVKSNKISDLHCKFPAIIVDNWNEINFEKLNNDYEENFNKFKLWKIKNKDSLNINYWL